MLVAKKELDYYLEQVELEDNKPKKIKKKSKSKVVHKLIAMGIAMVGLVLALLILFRYANITKIRQEITELERTKIELEREKEDLVAELETIKSSSKIEEDAMTKLGMEYPTKEQVVYIDVKEITPDNIIDQKSSKIVLLKQFKDIVNLVMSLF